MRQAMILGVVLLMLCGACLAATVEDGAGDAASFLRVGMGAHQRSMGGACTALSDGMAAAFWNPAPCVQTGSTLIGGELENRNGGLFQFSYLGGTLDVADWAFGALVLTSDMYSMYLLSGGYRIGQIALGLGAKSYQFGIPGDAGSGIGFDVGTRWSLRLTETWLTLAAVSRDIGWTSIKWSNMGKTTVDHVAWINRLGAALSVPALAGTCNLEADLEIASKRPPRLGEVDYREKVVEASLSLGLELDWSIIALRAGIQRYDLTARESRLLPTFGIGIDIGTITLDLAVVPSFLGSTYLGGFQVRL